MGSIQFVCNHILFDSNSIAFDAACCCAGGVRCCEYCVGGVMPLEIQAVIAGIIDDGCALGATKCDLYNDTYILPQRGGACVSGETHGLWHCGGGSFDVILLAPSPTYILRAQLGIGGPFITWEKDYGLTAPDCMNWNNEELLFVSDGGTACDGSGTSVFVTAI